VFRGQSPTVFVAAQNNPIRVAYCSDAVCSTAPVVVDTKFTGTPLATAIAPDASVVLASIQGGSVSVVRCSDSACTNTNAAVTFNVLSNPLVALLPISSGVQIVMKTQQRAMLVNLCGPFPQRLVENDITVTTANKEIVVQGVAFCPQDNILRLDDYPFTATVVSPTELRATISNNVYPGTYEVGIQNQNGLRFGVVLSTDLRVQNGCPFNCTNHGKCNRLKQRCSCDTGFQGADCSQTTSSPCPQGCGGNGICDQTSRQCVCFHGFTGPTCATAGIKCPNDCSNHGKCNYGNGQCKCSFFHCGADCSRVWPFCK